MLDISEMIVKHAATSGGHFRSGLFLAVTDVVTVVPGIHVQTIRLEC